MTKPLLYHGPPTRSVRVFWLLTELGVEFDVIKKDFFGGDTSKPDFLAVNALGTMPVYKDSPHAELVIESGASFEFIWAKYGGGKHHALVPVPGTPAHGEYLQMIWFAEATFSQTVIRFAQHTVLLPEEKRVPWIATDAKARLEFLLGHYEAHLKSKATTYLISNHLTGADIFSVHGLYLCVEILKLLTPEAFPLTFAWYTRLMSHAGARKAYDLPEVAAVAPADVHLEVAATP